MEGELGLNWYDYGARWYDASISRFTGVDPISDKFPHVTTYNYAENEPIANIDLWGLQKYCAASGEFILQQNDDESMRVVNSGSVADCQQMTCDELENNSTPVQLATEENKENTLSNWASQNKALGNRYNTGAGGDREYAMGLYSGEITDENGNTHTVFAEGDRIEGLKGSDRVPFADSKSPIEGWSVSEVIHTHRFGDNSGEFSDNPGIDRILGGDVQFALRTGITIYLAVPGSNTLIGSFTPSKYNEAIKSKTHERAVQIATNKSAIIINH